MNYRPEAFEALRRDTQAKIEKKLNSIGLFFRIFSRIKSPYSSERKKIEKEASYVASGKKMQDFLGIRITVYFEEDITIISDILSTLFTLDSESIDKPSTENFSPKRHNLVYKFPTGSFINNPDTNFIDSTFEVQIRTIFSEGWHEVEHDLRYKNKSQWDKYPAQSRGLNSIIATLEMCDWGISNIVEEMAYNAYKNMDIHSLILHKMKLRLQSNEISSPFSELKKDPAFLKKIYRSSRRNLLTFLSDLDSPIPIQANNILWILSRTQGILDTKNLQIPLPLEDALNRHLTGLSNQLSN